MARRAPRGRYLFVLSLAAFGVVYGDIGTSPLYAMRECFHGAHAIVPSPANILGVLSLIFWSLIIVISIKYLVFVLRADNHGEGGILSLTALATPIRPSGRTEHTFMILLGIYDPGEFSVFVRLGALMDCNSTFAELFQHFVHIVHAVIDHKAGRTWTEPFARWFC